MNPLDALTLLELGVQRSARHVGDKMIHSCGIVVPCPRFDGGWNGDPLGVPEEPNQLFLDTGWTEGVTRAWREHPILKEES